MYDIYILHNGNVVPKENFIDWYIDFNKEGETKALYCAKHKLEDMISIKSKYCIDEDCNTTPCFNYEGENKGLYCYKHKLDEMIDV